MKSRLSVLIALLFLMSTATAIATGDNKYPVILCQPGDVVSVDLVYQVSGDSEAPRAEFEAGSGIYADWNYVTDTRELYISIASSDKLDLSQPLAAIDIADPDDLVLVRVLVNGKEVAEPVTSHTREEIPEIPPTRELTGLTAGAVCSHCGAILEPQEIIPSLGPVISAVLNKDGELNISGKLSNATSSSATVFMAIYKENRQMLKCVDASNLIPNSISLSLPACEKATAIKIFQLDQTLSPICDSYGVQVVMTD